MASFADPESNQLWHREKLRFLGSWPQISRKVKLKSTAWSMAGLTLVAACCPTDKRRPLRGRGATDMIQENWRSLNRTVLAFPNTSSFASSKQFEAFKPLRGPTSPDLLENLKSFQTHLQGFLEESKAGRGTVTPRGRSRSQCYRRLTLASPTAVLSQLLVDFIAEQGQWPKMLMSSSSSLVKGLQYLSASI